MSEKSFRDGVPAFVAAYDAIRGLIAPLGPGDALPGEVALADTLGVERLVVQEALTLLQEDGVVVRDRASWTIAPARAGRVAFSDSFHRMLVGGAVPDRRVHAAVEDGSTWVRSLLGNDERCLVWETVFARDGVLLASTLEFLVVSAAPPALLDDLDFQSHDVAAQPTLLEALGPSLRAGLTPQVWRLVQASRHSERLSWMDLPLHGIPATLTVVLADGGRPVYLAKNRFDLASFSVEVDLTGLA
jgi:hypothetical protein